MAFPNFKDKCFEKALFSPEDYVSWDKYVKHGEGKKPSKYIIIYSHSLLNYFKMKYKPRTMKLWKLLTIHQYKDIGLVCMTGIGAPNATAIFEELIALGGKTFLNIGISGGLKDFGVFLCNKALRDEGTSHHYLPRRKYVYPDKGLTSKFKKHLEKNNVEFEVGPTWTIDAPYRETIAEIKKYKKQGILTVEMEASALFAVAEFRKVKIASCFVVSDILGEDKWDPQFDAFHVRKKIQKLIDVAIDMYS